MRLRLLSLALVVLLAGFGIAQSNQKKSALQLTAQEKELLNLTNAERKKENLPPLKTAPLLFKTARSHSQNMAIQGKLVHDLDCKSPFDRLNEVKYDYQSAGENIAHS